MGVDVRVCIIMGRRHSVHTSLFNKHCHVQLYCPLEMLGGNVQAKCSTFCTLVNFGETWLST